MNHKFLLSISLLLALSFAVPVLACEPSRDTSEFTLEDYVNNAELIFVGTIVSGTGEYDDWTLTTVEVEVESYLKGEGAAVLEISGFGQGPDCLSVVEIGDELIFFAEYATDGSLIAAYLSAHDAVRTANPENIAEIQAITGQSIAPAPPAFGERFSRFVGRYWPLLGGLSLGILGVVGIYTFLNKSDERKPKAKREDN